MACSTRRSRNRQPLTWTLVVSRKPAMVLLDDAQPRVHGIDGFGHVFPVDLTELLDAEAVEFDRAGQAHVPVLLAGLDELPGVTTVARDVERRLSVESALAQQGGGLQRPLARLLAQRRVIGRGKHLGDVD